MATHSCARAHTLTRPRTPYRSDVGNEMLASQAPAGFTALAVKQIALCALTDLHGEVGAAIPVDVLGFDTGVSEAILRVPAVKLFSLFFLSSLN